VKRQKDKRLIEQKLQPDVSQRRVELLMGALLFAFGVYHSVLYFGHLAVPNGDYPDFFREGRDLLSGIMPTNFKHAPVLGVLLNLFYPIAWGASRELTAGRLLNAVLHPFTVVLFWQVGKRIIGSSAVWFAIIAAINPWTIYSLADPVVETTFLFFILLSFYLIFSRSRWAYLAASIATMVRYEGAALILAAFLADIIHRKNRRDIINAFVFSTLASAPLLIWLILTAVTWKSGTSHYLSVFFSKEYAKGLTESANKTGLLLHLQLLWRVAFQSLLMPLPGASKDFIETLFKLGKTAAIVGFVLGCVFAAFKRKWEVLMLLLFFTPYFVMHAYYPYPLTRFHSTIFWVALLIAWFGLQSIGGLLAKKIPLPRPAVLLLQTALTIAMAVWCVTLVLYFSKAASVSPTSASMPYVSMLLIGLITAMRLFEGRFKHIPGNFCVACVLCLVIASNQFNLSQLLGDGEREIEFKQLGEWFAANAGPGGKMAVYMDGPTRLYAGENAPNIVGFPKSVSPKDLVDKLRQLDVTYVVWATREGYSHGQHTGYQQLGLNKNIAFLDKPRSIACYEFVRQIGSERGFVNVFRLRDKGDEQLPLPGN
jgi:hypothetical protein